MSNEIPGYQHPEDTNSTFSPYKSYSETGCEPYVPQTYSSYAVGGLDTVYKNVPDETPNLPQENLPEGRPTPKPSVLGSLCPVCKEHPSAMENDLRGTKNCRNNHRWYVKNNKIFLIKSTEHQD